MLKHPFHSFLPFLPLFSFFVQYLLLSSCILVFQLSRHCQEFPLPDIRNLREGDSR